MPKKKVLFFLESLAGGGAEKVLTDIVCNLDKTKFDVTVCTVTDGDIYQNKVESVCRYRSFLHSENYRAGGIRKLLFWLGMKLIYKLPISWVYGFFFREKYDVEIAFIEGFATKLIACSKKKHSKKYAWIHTDMEQNEYADSYYSSIRQEREYYLRFDKIFAVSNSVKEAFGRKFDINVNVYVQYNPVDDKTICDKAKEPVSLPVEVYPLLGTVGRLENQKGYLRLVKCAKQLRDDGYSFSLWIIGDGSQKQILTDYIGNNGLQDVVKLLGFHTNPYKYLNQCDAFVCSSYAEGFSTAATESLILGKPVFTVECAGMQELFGNQACGMIVDNTDDALYNMLKQIVSGEVQIDSYRSAVAERAEDFQISKRIAEVERLLLNE